MIYGFSWGLRPGRHTLSIRRFWKRNSFLCFKPMWMLQAKEWKVSLQDVSVAHLAKRHGGILLSGDKRLRTKSAEAGIEVKGILWVLDMIVERKLLIPQRALNALEAILEAGGRIPSEECGERRQRWGK